MAGKEFPLSIILRAVDRFSGTFGVMQKRINAIATQAGLPRLVDGFRGVGSAVRDLSAHFTRLALAASAALYGFKRIVDSLDNLGDAAERIGVSVDALAQLRYAAKLSGASVEDLDGGLQAFSQSLGQLRANTGRMASFLGKVSPALAKQLKGTKSNEEAFLLLADAMAKIEDPAKRAALAQKTVGNAALAPLLAGGAERVRILMKRYAGLAGSQEKAVGVAGQVDNAFHDLTATMDNLKASLVVGLGPAFLEVVQVAGKFFTENREKISAFLKDFGEKLPQRLRDVRDAFTRVGEIIGPVWDKIGGLTGAAKILAGVISGKLVVAIGSLGLALLTTPVGWFLGAVALIGAAAYAIVEHWDPISTFFSDLWLGVKQTFTDAWNWIKAIVDKIVGAVNTVREAIDWVGNQLPGGPSVMEQVMAQSGAFGPRTAQTETKVLVQFDNAPRGTRVTPDRRGTADVETRVGYQLGAIP